jgi:hypothetical protein
MLKTNSTLRKKRSYSTFTKFCYQKGTLPKDVLKIIPRSIKFNWQKSICTKSEDDIINAFETDALDYAEVFAEKEKAVQLSNALEEIIHTFQKIIHEHTLQKEIRFANKNTILATIEKLKDSIGFQKSCDYFSITTQQYYTWKNNIDCTASLLKLCIKRFAT